MKPTIEIPKELLTTRNAKTVKGEKFGWKTYILYMTPAKQNDKGVNLCPFASAGCLKSCLVGAGHGSMGNVEKGRRKRANYFVYALPMFLEQLVAEITLIEMKHKMDKSKFAIRLNGTSDIPYENIIVKDNKNIFELFPNVTFYDYTKNHNRFKKPLPKNYSLVFSRSEVNHDKAIELLKQGVNVAMVFDKLPETFESFPVINGDESDLRFLDNKGVIIGLKYKKLTGKGVNNNVAFDSGFAIRTETISPQLKKAA